MKRIFAVLAVLTLAAPAVADFKAGFTAYTKGDYTAAIRELKPLAKKGHATAQFLLGLSYANGQGVQQDYTAAAKWYRKAAEQGVTRAQGLLGLLYSNGWGVPQDLVQAHMWLNLAAARFPASETEERDTAVKNRDGVAAKMTPAQIAEAQKLAREWQAAFEKKNSGG